MKLICKRFDELTNTELYQILKVRQDVFILEQQCLYSDIDDIDRDSIHMFYIQDEDIVAYLRVFQKDQNTYQIGRVLTVKRGVGLGGLLLQESIDYIKDILKPKYLYLEAQTYAIGYYARAGFKVCSKEFLEDNIPHVQMIKEL